MSIIRCQNNCTYQNDGYCCLDSAVNISDQNTVSDSCVYYTPRKQKQSDEKTAKE